MMSVNQVHSSPEDDDMFTGHREGQLPIWVIARLKIKLQRARHAIIAKNEVCQKVKRPNTAA